MPRPVLSPALVTRFRNVALGRIGTIEAGWRVLTRQGRVPELEGSVFRELHTLKGEAAISGFDDSVTLTQSIEDLLVAARERSFAVSEDFDIVATMALQFLRLLVRRGDDASSTAIDMPRFLAQIAELVAKERESGPANSASGGRDPEPADAARRQVSLVPDAMPTFTERTVLSVETRRALGRRLAAAYVASAHEVDDAAPGRRQFVSKWRELTGELACLESLPLELLVLPHLAAARQAAEQLGKVVAPLAVDIDREASLDVFDAIGTFVLHGVRNAVVHGIEPPEERTGLGKPPAGAIRVSSSHVGGMLEIVVSDDGRGVALGRVEARGRALGLITGSASPPEPDLLALLFKPGFSTAESLTELAGRGVGLDAVAATFTRIGGNVTITSEPGCGTRISARVPTPTYRVDALTFKTVCQRLALAVPDDWTMIGQTAEGGTAPYRPCGCQTVGERFLIFQDSQGREARVAAGSGEVTREVVRRICPTSADESYELVFTEDAIALLLHLGA